MSQPSLSVVITAYNYGKYLKGCIESVLNQTWRDFEIIVVNDGSTDDTDNVIAPYLSDQRIHYVKQKNAGQANAKNTGIRHAKGDFIAFLDADDLWEANKLEEQIPLFQDPLVGLVYSTARYIDEKGNAVQFEHRSKYLVARSGQVTRHLFFDNFIPFSSSVVRKECLDRWGVFDEGLSMGIDWDLWLRLSVHYKFSFVDKPLLVYRIGHAGQMSKNLELRQRCSDAIINKFIAANPSHISPVLIRKMWQYTYMNRGYYYRYINLKRSSRYYLRALSQWPFTIGPLRGLLMNCVVMFGCKPKL